MRFLNKSDIELTPEAPKTFWPLQPVSFLFSLFAHAGVVCALAFLPAGSAEKPIQAAVYKMIDLKKEPLIYWARVPAALPAVYPETPIGDSPRFQAIEQSRNERIVVQQPNPDPAKQLVWQPDKPEILKTETPLQNMLAVQGKPVPNPFALPKPRTPVPESPKMLTAPEIQAAKTDLPATMAVLPALPTTKPKPKTFVPPKEQPKLTLAAGTVADAPPELTATTTKESGTAALVGTGALPKRPAPFVPPPARNRGGGAGEGEGKALATPPEVSAGGTGSTVTAAVIGLNPAAQLTSFPDGSRAAAFSRAGKVGKPSGGTPGQGPVIPGVAIAGNRLSNSTLAP
ncbi:MAG: hypothetical protein ABIO24_08420, partial [Saprospiraceae bacterium]